jgi:hypothetical protein
MSNIDIGNKASCGLGYVVVPVDVDRKDYIEECYNKSTVSFYPETGGTVFNGAFVGTSALRDLEFPNYGELFGSQILYLLHPSHKIPIVLAVVSRFNEYFDIGWKEIVFRKTLENREVSIVGDAKQGSLLFKTKSDKDFGGNISIVIEKTDRKGLFSIQCQGEISFLSDKVTLINKQTLVKSENTTLEVKPEGVFINGGANRGMVNITQIESLVKALMSDLLVVASGSNLSTWMATELPKLEDTKAKH